MAFRRNNCNEETIQVKLRGLDKTADYELINEDSEEKMVVSGSKLMNGYSLTSIDRPSSLLIWYKRYNGDK